MRGAHSVHDLHVHLVFVVKYRRRVITDRVRGLLIAAATDTCERVRATLDEADGEEDHLHLLVRYPPRLSVADLARLIKTNTSREVRSRRLPEVTSRLWEDHFWSPGYFAASAGGATLETIKVYIQNQRS